MIRQICLLFLLLPMIALGDPSDTVPSTTTSIESAALPALPTISQDSISRLLQAKRPNAQTAWGVVNLFFGATFIFTGVWELTEINRMKEELATKDTSGDILHSFASDLAKAQLKDMISFYQNIAAGSLITGAGLAITGTVFSICAKRNWEEYDALKLKLNLSYDPGQGRFGAVAVLRF